MSDNDKRIILAIGSDPRDVSLSNWLRTVPATSLFRFCDLLGVELAIDGMEVIRSAVRIVEKVEMERKS